MDRKPSIPKPELFPHPSLDRHRRQRNWQILMPVVVSGLLFIAIVVLIILTATRSDPSGNLSIWADASLIWLLMPVMVFAIFMVAILVMMIFLASRILKILPPYASVGQRYAHTIAAQVSHWSNKLVSPLIKAKSLKAGAGRAITRLLRPFGD